MADISNFEYANLMRMLQGVTRSFALTDKKLMDILNHKSTHLLAQNLTAKYFGKTKNIDYLTDITEMYRYWITLAPISNRIRQISRIEHNDNYILSWIRRNANQRVKRYYISEKHHKRTNNAVRILETLRGLSVEQGIFLEGITTIYEENYAPDGIALTAKIKMAHRMFDQLQFGDSSNYEKGKRMHRNIMLKMVSTPDPGFEDLRNGYTLMDSYKVRYKKKNDNGYYMAIEISDSEMCSFKEKIKKIINSEYEQHKKQVVLTRLITSIVEKWRYAVSAHKQIEEIALWLSRLGSLRHEKVLQRMDYPGMLVKRYIEKTTSTTPIPDTHNIFCFASKISQETAVNMFNPYL